MRTNRVREIWNAGGNVVNGWLASSSSYSAEIMASLDFDSVGVDLQHGMIDFDQALPILQAISVQPATPLARIPWNDPVWIMKVLDAGALGLICPMVNTAAEAEHLVQAMRYPPHGFRSFASVRGPLYMGPDYAKNANDTVIAFAMIETRTALDNIAEIVSVEGLDAIYIGPSDLALGIGHPPAPDPTEREVLEAIEHVRRTAVDAGVVPCIHTAGGDHAKRCFEQGFRLCTIANDVSLMRKAATAEIALARK
ncbi:HpcH/HpaI aldolase family protein [Minwuia thermotolerans]|uniref:2,4-dihydroxyhept-2-ene-1,7-dioic acid aldolase n=1 Tax=Minwuia thermotolerans TaxID=2056226 RepID=A0A2M9FZ97_9PROT|nr:aldolase/citrate lyase family protein [Minwuia thermotolerans]PJK28783.1 2,4-dihydroxyhept-2-ene-1,7-dioic acid aldolase [Minwuia thermotolerans]